MVVLCYIRGGWNQKRLSYDLRTLEISCRQEAGLFLPCCTFSASGLIELVGYYSGCGYAAHCSYVLHGSLTSYFRCDKNLEGPPVHNIPPYLPVAAMLFLPFRTTEIELARLNTKSRLLTQWKMLAHMTGSNLLWCYMFTCIVT